MAKQDSYARVSIRIPPELYEKLQEAVGDKSLNAEIIHRLEASFPPRLSREDREIAKAMARERGIDDESIDGKFSALRRLLGEVMVLMDDRAQYPFDDPLVSKEPKQDAERVKRRAARRVKPD